jgi:sugar phosphate isomerase/epimerase
MMLTRRDLGKIALAALPAGRGIAAVNSRFSGVRVGSNTYSFRDMQALDDIIKAFVQVGIGEVELMSNNVEADAGAPSINTGPPRGGQRPGGAPPTPEQRAAMRARENSPEAQKAREDLRKWRLSAPLDKFKAVAKKFDDAGLNLQILCFNMNQSITDDEIDYGFQMAKALGVKVISSTTQVSVSKRVAPFADKHKIMVGFHNHSNVKDPNEFATPESFATAMSYSKYHGVNLDIGHFTAGDNDPIAYIKQHHGRITNLHLKDRKKNQGPNMPWGQGDTPIKEVLQLIRKEKFRFPSNIEYEYRVEGSDSVTEVTKCFKYCKDALA